MIIAFGSSIRRLLLVLALAAAFIVQAGTIPVDIDLSFFPHTIANGDAKADDNQIGNAWIFVLDHSGSMNDSDAMVDTELAPSFAGKKMKRWEALLIALKATLEQIEGGSVLQIVKVGGTKAELALDRNGMVVHNQADRKKVLEKVEKWRGPQGMTPLYHGLYLACQEAQRFIKSENRNVCIVVFSDGQDESNKKYTQKSIDSFKWLFDEIGFNACLNWIGKTSAGLPPPPFGPKFIWTQPAKDKNLIPVICGVRPKRMEMTLDNPLTTGGRADVAVQYSFSLSPTRWESLLAEGFDANIELEDTNGREIGGEVIHVAKGATSSKVTFRVSDTAFANRKPTAFRLAMTLPQSAKSCRFLQPAPVLIIFEARDAVTLASVKPDSGLVAKVGENITFSATGTEGATYSWSFGDGASTKGTRVLHSFAAPAPKGFSFSVTAEKAGLESATQSGTVTIVEAGVKLGPMPKGVKVGETAYFTCQGKGEVASYDWFVDDAPTAGEDARDGRSSQLSWKFEKAGKHSVRVRANMKRVSAEETPNVEFEVTPAPYAAIVKPAPNERFEAEAAISLEAMVEGGFSSGVWSIQDSGGSDVCAPIPAPVLNNVARGNFQVPETGGEFTVSFSASEGATFVKAMPVPFSAKAKNILLDIVSPVKDSYVRTDSPSPLKVVSVGISGSVEFFLVDEASGEEIKLAEAKIAADGSASVSHIFPSNKGQGERILIAKTADGKLISDPVPFVLETEADLILKSPANNAHVEYGGELDFEAEPSGAIKAKEVQWFLRPVGGVEEKIKDGTGTKYAHTFAAMPNRKSLTYEVYARAPLPDRTEIETDHVFVRALCPAIQAFIVQPQVNGVVLASIGKQVDYTVSLKLADGDDVSDVVWDMDDGAAYTNLTSVKHTYRDYGTYEIKASGRCAKCGEAFSVKAPSRLVVEKQPINASFAIRASATSPKTISGMIAQGRQITLIGQTSADIAKREWTCNGQIILGDDGKPKQGPSIEYRCKDVGEYVFGLTVYDDAGSSVGPEKHALRTYRLWAILLIAFVCLMIWGVLVWYWKGDDPRFWSILVRLDRKRDTSFKNLKESQKRPLKISVGDFWNTAGNVATIPMRILTRNLRDAGNWKKTGLGDGEITISSVIKNDKPIAVVQKLHGDFSVTVEDKADPGVFRLVSDTPEDPPVVLEIKQNIGDKTHVLYMVLSFVGLSLAAAGLIAWLAF